MTLIPFDDRDGFIWMDGQMMKWRDAQIHILSHGLHYGGSVFEGERAYNGVIFRSADHTARLLRSADLISMPIPFSAAEIEAAKVEVLRANNLRDAYVRPVAWRGAEEMGIGAPHAKTHVAIAAWVWPSYYATDDTGIKLCTTNWRKADPRTMPTASKAGCLYTIGTMVKFEAGQKGCQDAMMLDHLGNVAEATAANIFAVIDGVLKTPRPDSFLNGLTRQTILDLAQKLNIPASVEVMSPTDIARASEIFLTGTAAEVVAVGQIDTQTYKVGDITRKIRQTYADLVRSGQEYKKVA
jgi:branched-chain amino acid aminotransferase